MMAKFDNPHVHPSTPRMGNAASRWFGQTILRALGWKIIGQLPDTKKAIILGGPHTSNWDLIIALASMLSVGLRFSWMMKKEAFFWPLGPLWRSMSGVAIDRKSKNNITEQMTEWFRNNDNVWLGLTPEGTRTKVQRFKKGYLRIAKAANVPIFIVGIHGDRKEVILDKIWNCTGKNNDEDNAAIKAYYDANFVGINSRNS